MLPPLTSVFKLDTVPPSGRRGRAGERTGEADGVDRADFCALAAAGAAAPVDGGVVAGRAERALGAGEDARAAALAGIDGQE